MSAAAVLLVGEEAHHARREARRELVGLIRAIFDAPTHLAAHRAFTRREAHRWGKELARRIDEHLDEALVHRLDYNQGFVHTVLPQKKRLPNAE